MDLSKLSDEALIRLYNTYKTKETTPEPTAGQMAAEGVGPMQAGLIGAGKGFDDLIQGAKQLYFRATGDEQATQDLGAQQTEANKHYGALRSNNPISTSIGEAVPGIGAMFATGGSASLPMALGKAALASGGTEAAKYGTDQERLNRGAVGAAEGAVGTLGGYGLGRLITPRGITGAAPSREALEAAERLGVTLTPGQRTGDVPLRKLEQMLAQRTGSAGQFSDLGAKNQAAINRGAASEMGEAAEAITPDVLAAARTRIGSQFQTIMKGKEVKLGEDFLDSLVKVDLQHKSLPPSLRSSKVDGIIDDALDMAASGKIGGERLQDTRSALNKAATDAFQSGNSHYGQTLKGIVSALDDAAGKSLTKTEQAAWRQARKEWKALRILESGNVVQDGNVSAQLLKGQVRKADPVAYREGKTSGPMTDIARYAEGVRPMPDSGTAGNLAASQMGTPGGLFQTAIGWPLRYGMAKGMLSNPGNNWLSNGALSDEARKRLMQAGGGLLSAGGFPSQ